MYIPKQRTRPLAPHPDRVLDLECVPHEEHALLVFCQRCGKTFAAIAFARRPVPFTSAAKHNRREQRRHRLNQQHCRPAILPVPLDDGSTKKHLPLQPVRQRITDAPPSRSRAVKGKLSKSHADTSTPTGHDTMCPITARNQDALQRAGR